MGAPIGNQNARGPHKTRSRRGSYKSKRGSYLKHYNSVRFRAEIRARDKNPKYNSR